MANQSNVEQIYDCIDTSCMTLYEELKMPYLQGITETCNNILSQTITKGLSKAAKTKLIEAMKIFDATDYPKEEIRKAMQLAILKGLKHIKRSNADITPDTIGLLMTFILEKLGNKNKEMILFDPLAGTGNLLLTVANNMSQTVIPIGVDNNIDSYNLAVAMFDIMDYGEGIYYQDTFTFKNFQADAIVTDFPNAEVVNKQYFPFEVIKFHYDQLREGGYFLALIANDFFEKTQIADFKQIITSLYQSVGLITLPSTMFKTGDKSILILQKLGKNVKKITKFLVTEIPSFQDPKAVNDAIVRMNRWFTDNI
ncbi:MAG: hypothetical protein WC479_03935 [Candidatus Izemoplasmatales bacterium]|jgi:site-specific DNA-methyltransferase (adenine-specific)|nr:hypothetical protein [Candidatus Izemoplasmatales bacterium]MDD3864949.1 hypothetical protein [Candidatus Izemoplasmatales bacterium]